MARRLNGSGREVQINDVRASVRAALEKKYGSVAKFLHSKDAEKFGGRKIRCYLYDTGSINFEVIAGLAKWLGLGELKRDLVVSRSYKYILKNVENGE